MAFLLVAGCATRFSSPPLHDGRSPHPPAANRTAAMPEVIDIASNQLGCPAEQVAWTCPGDVCDDNYWPGDSTTLVDACGHRAKYRFLDGRWLLLELDGMVR